MLELFHLQMRTAQMMVEANTVIGLRMLGMAGVLPSDAGETSRMVSEKQKAFARAGAAASAAMIAGKTPLQAYGLALTPIGKTTRANAMRLTKRKIA
ncbi:antifreeze protein [Jannaschia sp. 2305UL9-9]|uniref:antifreeze protein n=1 Tax=Jannaschia sp. 2305UL9-9 TaxID=3121638 RepID=UPI0035275C6C